MSVTYVSLCGLSSLCCNRYSYSEDEPKMAANLTLSQLSAKRLASIL